MHKERLLKLADLLENLPKGGPKFNLDYWYQCGTVACAVGHAALDPWFRRRGLRLSAKDRDGECHPIYWDCVSNAACEFFFDIGFSDVEWLFMPDHYPDTRRGPKSVAKRIRKFVAENEK